jgi:hopanoid biosynthesis associated RND transporter like protein HpnN
MNTAIEHRIGNALARWTDWTARHANWVILVFLLLAGGSLYYAFNHLGINTDNSDMLDESLPFRQTLKVYKQAFPQQSNNLLLVIEGPDAESTYEATNRLSQRLAERPDDFRTIYWPGGGAFYEDQALYYLSVDELSAMASRFSRSAPLLAQLKSHPTAEGLLGTLQAVLSASGDELPEETEELLKATTESLAAYDKAESLPLSWQELLLTPGATEKAINRQLLIVQPELDFSNLFAAGSAIRSIRAESSELGIGEGQAISLRITGSTALAYEELKSVSQGMGTAALMSLLIVVALLWLGTGSFRILLYSIISLLVGLCLTAGFAALSIGSLNLISVAFAVLYIGLGIDFAIHFSLRYSEFRDAEMDNGAALREASRDVGSALVICALSTAIGFYAFIPTDFVGVSELGLISGTGMFISLLVSLSLLPALFALSPVRMTPRLHLKVSHEPGPFARFVQRFGESITVWIIIVGVIASYTVVHARFDYDVLNLRDQNSESVATYRDLLATSETPPWRLTVLAESEVQAEEYRRRLEDLPSVQKVVDVHDLLPAETGLKDQVLDGMREQVEGIQAKVSTEGKSRLNTLQSILIGLDNAGASNPEREGTIRALHDALQAVILKLQASTNEELQKGLLLLDELLMGDFGPTLDSLNKSLNQEAVELNTLPDDLRKRWVSESGTWRLMVFAKNDLSDINELRRFVNEVSARVPQVTDLPIINLASGEAAVRAFQQAFITALVLISLLLWILLRSLRDTLLVLLPLLLAGILTTAAGVLFDIPFNFANIITLPLLLGIGVDNGIHMVSRARTAMPADGNLLHTSTSRAVILSALTTVASFGNLAFSSHPGTASMGQLLTIGVLVTMVCTLLVLPSVLGQRKPEMQEA